MHRKLVPFINFENPVHNSTKLKVHFYQPKRPRIKKVVLQNVSKIEFYIVIGQSQKFLGTFTRVWAKYIFTLFKCLNKRNNLIIKCNACFCLVFKYLLLNICLQITIYCYQESNNKSTKTIVFYVFGEDKNNILCNCYGTLTLQVKP